MNLPIWIQDLSVPVDDFLALKDRSPSIRFLTHHCLQNKLVTWEQYLAWAQAHYKLPNMDQNYKECLIDQSFWAQVKDLENWSNELIPLNLWENNLYILAVEPVELELPFQAQFVLASPEQLDFFWHQIVAIDAHITREEFVSSDQVGVPEASPAPPSPTQLFELTSDGADLPPPIEPLLTENQTTVPDNDDFVLETAPANLSEDSFSSQKASLPIHKEEESLDPFGQLESSIHTNTSINQSSTSSPMGLGDMFDNLEKTLTKSVNQDALSQTPANSAPATPEKVETTQSEALFENLKTATSSSIRMTHANLIPPEEPSPSENLIETSAPLLEPESLLNSEHSNNSIPLVPSINNKSESQPQDPIIQEDNAAVIATPPPESFNSDTKTSSLFDLNEVSQVTRTVNTPMDNSAPIQENSSPPPLSMKTNASPGLFDDLEKTLLVSSDLQNSPQAEAQPLGIETNSSPSTDFSLFTEDDKTMVTGSHSAGDGNSIEVPQQKNAGVPEGFESPGFRLEQEENSIEPPLDGLSEAQSNNELESSYQTRTTFSLFDEDQDKTQVLSQLQTQQSHINPQGEVPNSEPLAVALGQQAPQSQSQQVNPIDFLKDTYDQVLVLKFEGSVLSILATDGSWAINPQTFTANIPNTPNLFRYCFMSNEPYHGPFSPQDSMAPSLRQNLTFSQTNPYVTLYPIKGSDDSVKYFILASSNQINLEGLGKIKNGLPALTQSLANAV